MAATYIETQKNFSKINVEVLTRWREKVVEAFWFTLCLSLFVILGPFSAPIVLGFLFFNNHLSSESMEPESLHNS